MVTLVWLLLAKVVTLILYSDEQPDSRLPWACSSRMYEIYKVCSNLAVAFLLQIAKDNNFGLAVGATCSLLLAGLSIYLLYSQVFISNKMVYCAQLTTESAVAWISCVLIINFIANVNMSNPVFLGAFAIVQLPLVIFLLKWRETRLLTTGSINLCTSSLDVEMYARVLYSKLVTRQVMLDSHVEGLIAMHASSCKSIKCPCHSILTEARSDDNLDANISDEDISAPDHPPKGAQAAADLTMGKGDSKVETSGIEAEYGDTFEGSAHDHRFLGYLITEIERWNQTHDKKARLFLYLGNLKFFYTPSPLSALYEVMSAEEESSDIYEQYHMYRLL
jgi:hypothetical protein